MSLLYKHVCNFAPVAQLTADECIWYKQLKIMSTVWKPVVVVCHAN